ncbi:conserved domain protein [ [[Propionibacterium] namnetense SK182B-JCVI]|uniref:Conserved domain protein n=1 Tax=[Propionibacterium] namnetense SK182B-JCVI TaxID=1051006 RepID=F9NX15_9ACTN|nr:conserved domain protein [ [[Propionibacterium] namnetense SK182B-JCVI]
MLSGKSRPAVYGNQYRIAGWRWSTKLLKRKGSSRPATYRAYEGAQAMPGIVTPSSP